ncbi:nitroreductase family protein [Actinoplanes philippinensis]|uniref:nitroreductase family protein n=1 Tax=Actinoplanes philippinensis TaxID=35752 RepID=UPI0033D9126A
MFSDAITHPTDTQVSTHALAEAATIGGYAPSICNTQPWRWRLTADTLELCLASEWIMRVTDPEARLATPSCGAALHHAHGALRAQGWDAWQGELGVWAGGTRPSGSGVPDAAIPNRATQTTVPGRDFGHYGDLPISAAHDESAVFVTLYDPGDDPIDWLRAGEALSACWLTATMRGAAVLPIEVMASRQAIRAMIASVGHPYLWLRLGRTDPAADPAPQAPRLPAEQTIDRA